MAVTQDLYRGDSFPVSLELTSTSSAGTIAFDLTNYTATVSLRWPKCQTLNLHSTTTGELTIASTAGTITGTFPATATSTLPDAMSMYLVLETTVPTKKTYFLGKVKVASCHSSTELCFNG
jgi:hypothetical protein